MVLTLKDKAFWWMYGIWLVDVFTTMFYISQGNQKEANFFMAWAFSMGLPGIILAMALVGLIILILLDYIDNPDKKWVKRTVFWVAGFWIAVELFIIIHNLLLYLGVK